MTREEAIKILKSKMDGSVDTSYEWAEALRMAIEALQFVKHFDLLKEYQSLQEVVRCKDCIHYENDESVCRIDDMIVDDTDYCSYGEKSNKTSIDVGQLSFGTPITMTESLTDMSPMEWSKDVLNGEKKVEVKADNKDCAVGERSK